MDCRFNLCLSRCGAFRGVFEQAIGSVSYSSACMVSKIVRYLFIADIRSLHKCYHQLVVSFNVLQYLQTFKTRYIFF